MEKFSVLMSIYYREKPEFLELSLKSIMEEQTVIPSEIVVVKDGPVTKKLDEVLEKYDKKYPGIFKFIALEKNKGLGYALRIGIKECTYELIMRMDTDDIAVKTRFEKQIEYMKSHKNISAVGGYIEEFQQDYKNETLRLKRIPCCYDEIIKYAKFRNPMNHVTVCFRKKDILEVGSYKPLLFLEDYFLWIRLLIAKREIANIPETFCYVRIGNGFTQRRGAKDIIPSWKELQNYMYKNKFINFIQKLRNMLGIYTMIYVPNSVRNMLYNKILRKK